MISVLTERSERASRRMMYLLEQYQKAFPNEPLPIDPARVALWAYDQGLWRPTITDPREVLRRKLCRALRHQYITDPQGREVRANFSAVEEIETTEGPKRRSKWYPIFKAPPEVARQAFSLERRQALANVAQMKLDFDSYNDNNDFGAQLEPLDLDFNKDIEEMSLPDSYIPNPEDEEEEDD
jgi:hypothetical protein